MYCLCRYVLWNRTSPIKDRLIFLLVWYWVPSICLILINTSVICLDQGPLVRGTTWSVRPPQLTHVLSMFSTLKYFPTSRRIFQIHFFSFDFVLGNIVETEVWEFEFIPITHRHTAVFLAGHLVYVPMCTYQYTSPAAAWMGMLETRSISPGWPRFGLWYVKPA